MRLGMVSLGRMGANMARRLMGDFQVLAGRGRRALRVHLGKDVDAALSALGNAVREALK